MRNIEGTFGILNFLPVYLQAWLLGQMFAEMSKVSENSLGWFISQCFFSFIFVFFTSEKIDIFLSRAELQFPQQLQHVIWE